MICDYCKKEFKTKYTLKCHLERNKKCMVQRGVLIGSEFICQSCEHVSMTKYDLDQHLVVCRKHQIDIKLKENELKILLTEKDKQIETLLKHLKDKDDLIKEKDTIIKELAEKAIINTKPTTNINHTTHNTINNLHIISEKHFKDQAKMLTIEHIKKGALGYSEYFLEYPLKERIACTDYSRRKLKYKNEQGEIVSDPEMTMLSDLLFKSIKERNRELTIQYSSELSDKFKTTTDASQLAYFMEVAGKFSQQDVEVFRMFNGDKNEFFHDILRNICSKTLAQ